MNKLPTPNPDIQNFIVINFNLPDHTKELITADNLVAALTTKINQIITNNSLTSNLHTSLYEDVIKLLDWAGRMSMPLFEVEDDIEALYVKEYIHCPALAKELFYQHYEQLHKPYTLLKHRCYWLLDKLDATYQDKFHKTPPNWNI